MLLKCGATTKNCSSTSDYSLFPVMSSDTKVWHEIITLSFSAKWQPMKWCYRWRNSQSDDVTSDFFFVIGILLGVHEAPHACCRVQQKLCAYGATHKSQWKIRNPAWIIWIKWNGIVMLCKAVVPKPFSIGTHWKKNVTLPAALASVAIMVIGKQCFPSSSKLFNPWWA